MAAKRYTIVLTDRSSGVTRQLTVSARPVFAMACAALTLPVLVGMGVAWKGRTEVAALYASHKALEEENASYREATGALPVKLSLFSRPSPTWALSRRSIPAWRGRWNKLPALVKSRAMGGAAVADPLPKQARNPTPRRCRRLPAPKTRSACSARCSKGSNRGCWRCAGTSSAATPWPRPRRRSGRRTAGSRRRWAPRRDPVTGGADFHAGLDIAGGQGPAGLRDRCRHGQPARLSGRVRQPDRHRPRLRSRNPLRPPLSASTSRRASG